MSPSLRLLAALLLPAATLVAASATPSTASITASADHGVVAGAGATSAKKKRGCANGKPSRVFRDRTRDAVRGIDVHAAGVWNKDRDDCYWVTITGDFSMRRAQVIQVVYDTDRRYQGYEYSAFAYSPKDGDKRRGHFVVRHYKVGKKVRSVYVACPAYSRFDISGGEIRLGVAKSCFGRPVHVRVQVQFFDITKYRKNNRWRGRVDYLPNGGYTPLF